MSEPQVSIGAGGPSDQPKRAWAVLSVVTGALFLEGIDIAMLNVAIPSIAWDIGLAPESAHWVISAYVLAYAGFMILGGSVADALGRSRVFLAALAVFAAFSLVGGLAQEPWILITVRFVTGAAAGFMTPAGFGLLTTAFPVGAARNKALAIYGAIGASGFLMGVVAGGLLTELDWRLVFIAPAILGLGFFVTGLITLPSDLEGRSTGRGRFDLTGGVLLTGTLVSVVMGVVSVGDEIGSPVGWSVLVIAVLLFAAFTVHQQRSADPLIPVGLLFSGFLPWVGSIGLLFIGAFFAWQFVLTLYLQDLLGWSAVQTGMAFAAMGVELLIAPTLTPWLTTRFGNVVVMTIGLTAVTIGFALTLRLDSNAGFLDLLPSLLLLGVAFAFIYGPLTASAVEGVEARHHGVAGGIVYTGFQFGAALGVSIATIVLVGNEHLVLDLADYRRALIVPAVAAALALVVGVMAGVRSKQETQA